MKTYLLSALTFFAATTALAQSPATLRGHISGLNHNHKVYLVDIDAPSHFIALDSTVIADDGSFLLHMGLKSPHMCSLAFYQRLAQPLSNGNTMLQLFRLPLFLDGRDNISLASDTTRLLDDSRSEGDRLLATDIQGGGKTLADYMAYRRFITVPEDSALLASYAETDAYFKHDGDKTKYSDIILRKEQTAARLDSLKTVWLEQHATTAVAAFLLSRRYYQDYTYPVALMNKWIAACTADGAEDTARVSWLSRNADIVRKQSLDIPFHDFKAQKTDGSVVALSALRQPGKFTLIDFWASWCGICRASTPAIKTLYGTLDHAQFEVISVSCDEDDAAWRKAMQDDQMPWAQYCLTPDGYKAFFANYQTIGVPYYLLVNPEGKVIANPSGIDEVERLLNP